MSGENIAAGVSQAFGLREYLKILSTCVRTVQVVALYFSGFIEAPIV